MEEKKTNKDPLTGQSSPLGRWSIRNGSRVVVTHDWRSDQQRRFGMYWDSDGKAIDPSTHTPAPEYDLMERTTAPADTGWTTHRICAEGSPQEVPRPET
jgi:hypothetical protein